MFLVLSLHFHALVYIYLMLIYLANNFYTISLPSRAYHKILSSLEISKLLIIGALI